MTGIELNSKTTHQEIKDELGKCLYVRIEDYTDYDESKCRNGGAYSYTTIYHHIGGDEYFISYDSSADECCPYCGQVFSQCDCNEYEDCTEVDVIEAIMYALSRADGDVQVIIVHQ